LTREQTVEMLERRAHTMGVTDFALSLRQLDRWFAGELTKRPRPSVCRVIEAEFGYSVDVLLAPEGDAPSLLSTAAAPTRALRTTDFLAWIADQSGWPFADVYSAVADAADRRAAQPLATRTAAEHARAAQSRAALAAAVHSSYDGPAGFYTATVADTCLSLSMLVEPTWLGLAIPLDDQHQRFQLDRSPIAMQSTRLTPIGVQAAIERLASVEAGDTILLDNPVYQLRSLDLATDHIGARLGLSRFAVYALTCDLLEGELVASMGAGTGQGHEVQLPLRDLYLPNRSLAVAFEQRICVGGPACLLAIARPDDYLLLIQKRSGRVVNVPRRLAVIPKAFHQPLGDDRDANLSATVDRELEEELLGRVDLEQLSEEDGRRAAPRHPGALSDPMRWLIGHPDAYQAEATGFGINMLGGNYEFACLVLIEDPAWWEHYGHRVQANWEADRIMCYSSRDTEGLAQLTADPNWSNEGLFAFLESLRRLSERNPAKTAIPAISLTC
jgi:hypothetical protein